MVTVFLKSKALGNGAAMPFSSKAQEIHDHIVSSGKADYWIGVARSIVQHRGQHQPGKRYPATFLFLETNSKPSFLGAVNNAHDHHWEEIAHWLV
jgi:hypothetical protein